MLAPACTTCGGQRHGFGDAAPTSTTREVAPAVVLGASVVLPGAGHLAAGRYGTGAARSLLWLLWLLPGLSATRSAEGGPAVLPGIVLLLGAASVWGATLVDAQRLAAGEDRELLAPRPLLWLVAGVIIATVLAMMAATVAMR